MTGPAQVDSNLGQSCHPAVVLTVPGPGYGSSQEYVAFRCMYRCDVVRVCASTRNVRLSSTCRPTGVAYLMKCPTLFNLTPICFIPCLVDGRPNTDSSPNKPKGGATVDHQLKLVCFHFDLDARDMSEHNNLVQPWRRWLERWSRLGDCFMVLQTPDTTTESRSVSVLLLSCYCALQFIIPLKALQSFAITQLHRNGGQRIGALRRSKEKCAPVNSGPPPSFN